MQDGFVVVIVDDEPDLRRILADVLEDEGFTVLTLHHPAQALTLGPHPRPVLFLVDMMLPGMTGIELAGKLKAGQFRDVPLVALSASPVMLQRAAESHLFATTIPKPFELDRLLDSVRQYSA